MQLYTIITVVLGSQAIYYGYIYPRSQYKRLLKVQTPIPLLMLHNSYDLFNLYMSVDYNRFPKFQTVYLPPSISEVHIS